MRKILTIIFAWLAATASAQEGINVMTFNIRYNNPGDSLNAWPYRKDKAVSQILFHQAQLVGVQEALAGQLADLTAGLGRYKYLGAGRADGKDKGEFSAILYDTTRFEALQSQTFWLAKQTDVPGLKGWDAAFERVVTWAKFRDRKTKQVFYHFNTHFDHVGQEARRESARLLLQKVKAIAQGTPALITGDFNAMPADEPIRIITDAANPDHLTDTKALSLQPHYGPTGTFNAFGPKETSDQPIDHIFINRGWQVFSHATLSETWQGRFSSDHFPVIAKVALAKKR